MRRKACDLMLGNAILFSLRTFYVFFSHCILSKASQEGGCCLKKMFELSVELFITDLATKT